MLDFEQSTKFCNHGIFEVGSIFSDNPFGDTVTVDGVMLDDLATILFVTEANEAASTHLLK